MDAILPDLAVLPESREGYSKNQVRTTLWYEDHYRALTAGIEKIEESSLENSELALMSENVFPVLVSEGGAVRIAGGVFAEVCFVNLRV